ncbi:olfactory receptor 11L1-like [Pelobates fuscus]|uniref:olfactory receptor 11L1-like n=1 Tax=Pelobates fuscus TaxID=191477 RepID=UPI002FE4E0C0
MDDILQEKIHKENKTMHIEFLLLGFPNIHSFQSVFFCLLLFYFVTVSGNLTIIWLVVSNTSLHTPMYFFLTQLSLSDIILTTNIVPNTLSILLQQGKIMSFSDCMTQFYFFGSSESSECLFLTVMAYDRYLAICTPLHYTAIMHHAFILKLVIVSWCLSFSLILISTITVSRLQFCGPNVIDHFFCDLDPLIAISCSDTSIVKMAIFILCFLLMIIPLIIILMSYTYIVLSIIKIASTNERGKVFSTCGSHLSVVSIFYGTLIGIYILPTKGLSTTFSKVISLFYTVVTPMLNPIIYSLRNKDIKQAIKYCISIVISQR